MAKSHNLTKAVLLLSLVAIIKANDYTDASEEANTSCGKTLCEQVENYPYNDIVYGLRSLTSDGLSVLDRSYGVLSHGISTEVYRKVVHLKKTAKGPFSVEKIGCRTYTEFYPQEGQSVNGNKYYIVNVIKRQQPVLKIECSKFCTDRNTDALLTCEQNYEEVELLALPMDWNNEIAKMEIQRFQVPHDCGCEEIGKKDHSSSILYKKKYD